MKPASSVASGVRGSRLGWRTAAVSVALAGGAVVVGVALPGAGAAPAASSPATTTPPSPSTLLAPPVIVNGGPDIGYLVWVRTPEPLGEGEPGRDLEISVPSLGLRSSVEREGTPPTRSSAGGWCVRVGLGGFKLRSKQSDPPRVVTVRLKGSDGLEQVAFARLQTAKKGSAASDGVPRAQSGCRKGNSGGPG